jgi:Ribbon-helix-helix protein, copG family
MAKVKKEAKEQERYFTRSGVELTPEVVDELVAEAERGYEPSQLRAQYVGRPSLGASGVSPRIAVRVPADLHAAAQRRADEEGKSISELARDALREHLKA